VEPVGAVMSNRAKIFVALSAVCAFLLLSVPSEQFPIDNVDTSAADSAQYHFIALNLLQGKGYHSRPIGAIEAYGEGSRVFLDRPIQTPLEDRFKVAAQRGPGYPLFLAAIYAIHGPRPDVVIRYQAVLAGLTGVLLVLIARRLWGSYAGAAGVVAALLLRHEAEMRYAISTLMSECLAAFLLALCLLCALWAKRGGAWREVLVGLLMSAAVLTRQALLLTALLYGFFLLFPLRASWKRALAFALPCAVAFSGWSMFLSAQSGGTVVMASTGSSSMLNGLDPALCAAANGIAAPAIDEHSLADYWGGFPTEETPGLSRQVFRRLPSRLPEVLQLVRVKLKIGFLWMPQSLIWCVLLGTALASALIVRAAGERQWIFNPRSRLIAGVFCAVAALTLGLFTLGYSHPLLQMACLLLVPAAMLVWRSGESRLWMSSWLLGYVGMTILTIGVRRYIRPYLPVMFLFAVAAIPLFVVYVSGLLDATYSIGGRTVRFRWPAPSA
jgi:4-amino-4-deoxy-L-arabinose transferase-like glycosyltransferase